MDVLIFIPALVLVLLTLVRVGDAPSLKRAGLVWIGLLVVLVVVRLFIPDQILYPRSEAVKRVQGQLKNLRTQKDWAEHPVLILEGSSVTLFGVNDADLQKKLRETGINATVLQFSMAGANHFERLNLLNLFFKSLTSKEREAFRNAQVTLLSEVFDAYDENPLYLFAREAYSERVIAYTSPRNSYEAWRAYRIYKNGEGKNKETAPVLWPLLENTLLNEFGVGTFSDMKLPERIKRTGGFFALTNSKASFDFQAAWTSFQSALAAPTPISETVPYPQWQRYYETLQADVGDYVDHAGFYALPLLEGQRYAYQLAFAAHLPARTVMMGPPAAEVYQSLDQPEDWFDGTHPQEVGSRVFTDWLATEIIRQWPQLTRERWLP